MSITSLAIKAERLRDQPVVAYGSLPGYGAIFNAGLIHHDGTYHLFARGVREGYTRNTGGGPRFLDYVSDVLVFVSHDGHDYRYSHVLARAGDHGVHCFEDPRVQIVEHGDGPVFLMTYTNLPAPESGQPWRIGMHLLNYTDGRFTLIAESGRLLGPDGHANKDAVVFPLRDGRIALMHRLHPDMQVAVFDSLTHLLDADETYWDDHLATLDDHVIIRPSPGAFGVGAGAPPLATEHGLLLFFHERNSMGIYTMNVALLDAMTGKVRSMLPHALLDPELDWERYGDVDDVVFVQGVHRRDDGTIYLTYGAADSHVGAALVSEQALLEALLAAEHA